jgi:hypothetical protein
MPEPRALIRSSILEPPRVNTALNIEGQAYGTKIRRRTPAYSLEIGCVRTGTSFRSTAAYRIRGNGMLKMRSAGKLSLPFLAPFCCQL